MPDVRRLFVKVTRETLPQVCTKHPFLYLEHGRLEVDDSSVKWIDAEGNVVRLPCATINVLLLGPGTSLTHEAVKTLASANCGVCWVGEDSLRFYAFGDTPTSDSRNFLAQMRIACDRRKALEVARRMYASRFPETELAGKSLKEMMGMEGRRVRSYYSALAAKYKVGWKGRSYVPGRIELSDTTNKNLTVANAFLYAVILSVVHALGYSPHIGFIHSGSPLPFVYDLADLYKDALCIDLAFRLTLETGGVYQRERVQEAFRERLVEERILERLPDDIEWVLYGPKEERQGAEEECQNL